MRKRHYILGFCVESYTIKKRFEKNQIFLRKSVDKQKLVWYYSKALERDGQKQTRSRDSVEKILLKSTQSRTLKIKQRKRETRNYFEGPSRDGDRKGIIQETVSFRNQRYTRVYRRERIEALKNDLDIRKDVQIPFFREFDPGSGRTLAACLTHASRTD